LSIFSRDQQTDRNDIDSGGRGLQAIVRPYARRIAGEPLRMGSDLKRRIFELKFRHDANVTAPTEIFVPEFHYPKGYAVEISDGTFVINREEQTLLVRHDTSRDVHQLTLKPRD